MDAARPDPATVWRSADHHLDDFRISVARADFDTLVEAATDAAERGAPVEELTTADLPLGPLERTVAELSTELRSGTGFRLLGGVPTTELSIAVTERVFWGIGLRLGTPVSQSVMGERLGHVIDVTKTDPHARAYRNSSELTPHSDPADLLSFLCIHPAAVGGVSRFVSSMAIHEELRAQRPDLLERLYRGFHYHRGGEQQPGDPDITPHRVPVFSEHDGHVSARYVRFYIEVAAEQDPTITLDDLDREAIDMLEALAADPSLHFEFTLGPGEAVFANNFTVMHARASFEDRPEHPARHLLRLWLSTDPPRPLTPDIWHYEGEPGIPPVQGRTPSFVTSVDVQ